jgi:hypothetical protein
MILKKIQSISKNHLTSLTLQSLGIIPNTLAYLVLTLMIKDKSLINLTFLTLKSLGIVPNTLAYLVLTPMTKEKNINNLDTCCQYYETFFLGC